MASENSKVATEMRLRLDFYFKITHENAKTLIYYEQGGDII